MIQGYAQANIPLETFVADLNYMDATQIWTLGPAFPQSQMQVRSILSCPEGEACMLLGLTSGQSGLCCQPEHGRHLDLDPGPRLPSKPDAGEPLVCEVRPACCLHTASLTWGRYSLWQACHWLGRHGRHPDLDPGSCLPSEPDTGEFSQMQVSPARCR